MNESVPRNQKPRPDVRAIDQSVSNSIITGDVIQISDVGGNVNVVLGGHSPKLEVPAQLPSITQNFVGRVAELKTLNRLIDKREREPRTVIISVLSGMAGVGKTALAIRWACQVAKSFPDGQLYVNLRGFDPHRAPVTPSEAIRGFLDAFGVPPERVPASSDAQAALYRSLVSGRRLLVVLDNARNADQVRPLLPGSPTALVVVTSRNQLSSLVATEGARLLTLDLLTHSEAWEMLDRCVGHSRTAAEPRATDEIIMLCARLPLALAIAAARAVVSPAFSLASIVSDLRARCGLALLDPADPSTNIRAVFSWSYEALTFPAARLFRMMGLHLAQEISIRAAASLANISMEDAQTLLAELTSSHMITEYAPGRYSLHDLIRSYAAELAQRYEAESERNDARCRELDHYLHSSHLGARLLNPRRDAILLDSPLRGVKTEMFADDVEASAWFTAEYSTLLGEISEAYAAHFYSHTWKLAWTLTDFLDRRGRWQAQIEIQRTALAAAGRLMDRSALALTHRTLARAYARLALYNEAHENFSKALEIFEELEDRIGTAHTHHSFGITLARQGRDAEALSHARRAYALYANCGHLAGQAEALNSIGWYQAQLGDYEHALASSRRSLTLYEQIGGHRSAEAATWDTLGYIHQHMGDIQKAIASYESALRLHQLNGDLFGEATVLTHIGDSYLVANKDVAACGIWQRAMEILEEIGHPSAKDVRAKILGAQKRVK